MMELDPNLVDHAVQKDIIRTLVHVSSARFSELKPTRVESNLFMYHLKQLIAKHVIEKDGANYRLTVKGKLFVDRVNLDKLVFRIQPKIITILTIKSTQGTWLLLERTHEPHMNMVGFPSGKIHFGETLDDSAKRELKEKTGIEDLKLLLRGNIIMRFTDKTSGQIVNHISGYVFSGTSKTELKIDGISEYWRSFWGDEDNLSGVKAFKGHDDIIRLLKSNKEFVESFDYLSDF
jgi:8-oxo-dGTP pyrophosphatase MutT (NUDIX family)